MSQTTAQAPLQTQSQLKVLSGNYAAAYGAKLARAEVVSAFPITPQTTIVEKLAELIESGEMRAQFVPVESEHSVMAVVIGACSAGARCFTATSSQGLALMHELVHWAGRGRMPIVMVNANRALGPPWQLGAEQDDSLSQRDTGWVQFYCESNQEVLDTVLQGFRIAERVSLPVMLSLDGFYLTHTSEPVYVPEIESVDRYLPPKDRRFRLDPSEPLAFGVDMPLQGGNPLERLRFELMQAMETARVVARQADDEFREHFGRGYGLVEPYLTEDAEVVLVTSATVTTTARMVAKGYRERGKRVGVLKIRMFRPFPVEEVVGVLSRAKKVAVVDRNMSYGHGGVFATEVKAAMYGRGASPPIFEFIAGMAGTEITPAIVSRIFDHAFEHETAKGGPVWLGMSA